MSVGIGSAIDPAAQKMDLRPSSTKWGTCWDLLNTDQEGVDQLMDSILSVGQRELPLLRSGPLPAPVNQPPHSISRHRFSAGLRARPVEPTLWVSPAAGPSASVSSDASAEALALGCLLRACGTRLPDFSSFWSSLQERDSRAHALATRMSVEQNVISRPVEAKRPKGKQASADGASAGTLATGRKS